MKKILLTTSFLFICHLGFSQNLKIGAELTEVYFPLLKGKKIGIAANQSSLIGNVHLVDSIHKEKFNIISIFSPEHGFRGDAEAGATISNAIDKKTGLPIISLYGKDKKPSKEHLKNIDIMLFDLQDVGARFYTYISTLHYMMEACAENNITLIILDRPNPNGHYVDGPILEKEHQSFVGMHPIPIVHGMTMAEYAQMINGEGWLQSTECDLILITMEAYNRMMPYKLPVAPSPNLPTEKSIALYPSLCFFEGTDVSIGRGTEKPFEIYGHPDFKTLPYQFTPVPIKGKSENPPQKNKLCYGEDLSLLSLNDIRSSGKIELKWLIKAYQLSKDKPKFFNTFFEKLAGTAQLRKQITEGWSEEAIRASWKDGLEDFLKKRQAYLLYE